MNYVISIKLLILLLNLLVINCSLFKPVFECRSCQRLSPDGKVNVHLVPHSHNDVGWVETIDEYYNGDKDIYGVKDIIKSTLKALLKNPRRRFIQVETSFLWKWWKEQDNKTRQKFQKLVNEGRLEIINGAWSMNDEAVTNYQSIIDQFTWGFYILSEILGPCARPKIGWQIDPFGHSKEHASIIKQFGFQGLVIGRIDYRDKLQRIEEKNLDFMWKTSNYNSDADILTTIFPNFYTYEYGFCFDAMCFSRMDSKGKKMSEFLEILDKYKNYYKTSNILIPMGSDFSYKKADINFKNMDKLIESFKGNLNYNVFYSTPSCYLEAVRREVAKKKITLAEKTDDFFPYASDEHSYWTGYFTSRPTIKKFERIGNNILQSAKQLATFSRIMGRIYDDSLTPLREAMGVLQHHDAITGTETQDVANDYVRILHQAIKEVEAAAGAIIGHFLEKEVRLELQLSTCLLANISICEISKREKFLVVVYNPLSHIVSHYVRLPVDEGTYRITGPEGRLVYDIFDTIHSFDYVKEDIRPSKKELVFQAKEIPGLSLKVYYVEKTGKEMNAYRPRLDFYKNAKTYFGTERKGFIVDSTTGRLISVTLNGKTLDMEQEFRYYLGEDLIRIRSSGAYIFRPVNATTKPMSTSIKVKFAVGIFIDQVYQYISPEITQIIRVYKKDEDPYIEFDWLVGDLQYDSKFGKEVVTVFKVKNFTNNGTFYTDSNGRVQIKREKDKRQDFTFDGADEPVSSNYYPVTSKIVIKDEEKQMEVAVLTDRAQGGTSLNDGTIELMIHRRLVADDGFGVNEILNETEYERGLFVRGQHFLVFGSSKPQSKEGKSTAAFERDLAQRKLLEPWILLADVTQSELLSSLDQAQRFLEFEFMGLTMPLPNNVHILTLEPWTNSYLLRLEHILEKDEDAVLSEPIKVDLQDVFTLFDITEIAETDLSGNLFGYFEDIMWENVTDNVENSTNPLEITLEPMQIKTFLIKTNKNNFGRSSEFFTSKTDKISVSTALIIIYLFTLLFENF